MKILPRLTQCSLNTRFFSTVLILLATSVTIAKVSTGEEEPVEYGVDVSFPIHHETISNNYAWLPHNLDSSKSTPWKYQGMPVQPLGDRQKFYKDFLDGCQKHYGKKGSRCASTERERINMSLRQPKSMQNYTDIGFKKIRAPEEVYRLLKNFWDKNKDKGTPEKWGVGNTYTNHWESPSKMVSVEDRSLRGAGPVLKQAIWDAARDTLQEWTGEELTPCSLYGIRIYPEGSVLATHVDRLPLVSSAIINVDQDTDEPWPIEVYGHDGKAYNVTMEPGDMVLYESHSVLHGRPFPLKGRFYANVFIHFEPVGHSLRHKAANVHDGKHVEEKYKEAVQRGSGGHEADHDGLPSYILAGTDEEKRWRSTHAFGQQPGKQKSFQTGSTTAHMAAQTGDLETLKVILESGNEHLVHAKDSNGWTPLHEGARAGSMEVVEFLIKKGSKVNERTDAGNGGTALWWAQKQHGENHPVVDLLKSVGAISIGPDL